MVRQVRGHILHALQRRTYEVIEADPDVHLELNEKGKIIGIKIWNAEKSSLIKEMAKAIAEPTSSQVEA